jgi:hypothetical protein
MGGGRFEGEQATISTCHVWLGSSPVGTGVHTHTHRQTHSYLQKGGLEKACAGDGKERQGDGNRTTLG